MTVAYFLIIASYLPNALSSTCLYHIWLSSSILVSLLPIGHAEVALWLLGLLWGLNLGPLASCADALPTELLRLLCNTRSQCKVHTCNLCYKKDGLALPEQYLNI